MTELERKLDSIGKKIFIDNFEKFENCKDKKSLASELYEQNEKTTSLDAQLTRINSAKWIFDNDRSDDALDIIISSKKIDESTKDKARILLKKTSDENANNIFPDSADTKTCLEGAKISILVNKYERDPAARQKCIEHHGCHCHVCDLDFENIYDEIGKGFIHVHHLTPLHEVGKESIIDPIKDLLPVCPNCHAMLHRKLNGAYLSVDKLKEIIK